MPRKPTPKPAKATKPAKAATVAKGDLVQFSCPTAGRVVQEKVTGFVPEHDLVTVESGRHFPANEVTPVAE